jgi:hypothetical protein
MICWKNLRETLISHIALDRVPSLEELEIALDHNKLTTILLILLSTFKTLMIIFSIFIIDEKEYFK